MNSSDEQVAGRAGQAKQPRRMNPYPFWAPRFWHGMLLGDWLKLLHRHGYRVHPLRVPMAVIVTGIATGNSVLYRLQRLLYGDQVDAVQLAQPPLFIIGHWRSGTTLLHELVVRDPRHAYPTTYECFAANHFLITGSTFPKIFRFLLPSKRPMDDMAVSFDHPQEDEFALISMGVPSPLLRVAFPNDPPPYLEFLDMQGAAASDVARWKEKLLEFVRGLTLLKRKRIVLKSPPHTGRIELLSEMFPGAQFIHIVRDPYTLFLSNRRLWQGLDEAQAFQYPHYRELDEFIFSAFERMYGGFEAQRAQIPAGQIAETRYEDLVEDPLRELSRIYDELQLGDFELVRGGIEDYMAKKKNYRANRYELDEEIRAEIDRRWGDFRRRYGYA